MKNDLPISLTGKDNRTNVVALEPITPTEGIVYYRFYTNTKDPIERIKKSYVYTEKIKWNSWFLVHTKQFAEALLNHKIGYRQKVFHVETLKGKHHYKYYVKVINPGINFWDISNHIVDVFNKVFQTQFENINQIQNNESFKKEIYKRSYSDQIFIDTGITLFKGMSIDGLKILCFDLETTSLNPETGQIFLNSIYSNYGFKELVWNKDDDEVEILKRTEEIIQEQDPDIIIGYNSNFFDFNYIKVRSELLGLECNYGRRIDDFGQFYKTHFANYNVSLKVGEASEYFAPTYIFGRHHIDVLHLVKRYNAIKRKLENHKLKYVAQQFKLKENKDIDRTYIEGDLIYDTWLTNKEEVLKYAYEDTWETLELYKILISSTFSLSQMVPSTFQKLSYCGSATIWENLMVREYLRPRFYDEYNKYLSYSIPLPLEKQTYLGGFTSCDHIGMIENVHKADVSSLYPSIMLVQDIRPKNDDLNVCITMLRSMTNLRLSIKEQKNKLEKEGKKDTPLYKNIDGMQGALKIVINSLYGSYGSEFFSFNYPEGAEQVTTEGQRIIKQVRDILLEKGCISVCLDTDGIIFQPHKSIKDIGEFIQWVSDQLPEGINLDYEDSWIKIFSYKKKNYALIDENDEITIKGAALKSSSKAKYINENYKKVMECIFKEQYVEVNKIYRDIIKKLENREIPIEDICTSVKYSQTLDTYDAAIKNTLLLENKNKARQAHMELLRQKLKENGRLDYNIGDKVKYYKLGVKHNEAYLPKVKEDVYVECDKCSGNGCSECIDGKIYEYVVCPKCNGTGLSLFKKTIKRSNINNFKLPLLDAMYYFYQAWLPNKDNFINEWFNYTDYHKELEPLIETIPLKNIDFTDDCIGDIHEYENLKPSIEMLKLDNIDIIDEIRFFYKDEDGEITYLEHEHEDIQRFLNNDLFELNISVEIIGKVIKECRTCIKKVKGSQELLPTTKRGYVIKKKDVYHINCKLLEDSPEIPDYNIEFYVKQFIKTIADPFKVCFNEEDFNKIFSLKPLKTNKGIKTVYSKNITEKEGINEKETAHIK